MSKPARGTKRVCPSCGARFYDLSRTPIACPVCQAVYQVTPPTSRRGERAPVGGRKRWSRRSRPRCSNPRRSAWKRSRRPGEDAVEEDEEIVDLGDDAAEIPAAGDDDTFLEEEDEGEADVSGIVGDAGRGDLGCAGSRKPEARSRTGFWRAFRIFLEPSETRA